LVPERGLSDLSVDRTSVATLRYSEKSRIVHPASPVSTGAGSIQQI